jgi:tetratricopeptide (TPR) repeat protein/predicted Ser/Thr protein kinase
MTADGRTDGSGCSPTIIGRIESVCDRFEDAWRDGSRPRVEDFWAEGAGSPALLRELLVLEVVYRLRAGEPAALDDYLGRFPAHAALVQEAFAAAKAGGTAGPRASDPATLDVGETGPLPRAEGSVSTQLAAPRLAGVDADSDHVIEALARAGYAVTGELGRGGMGIVYEARQTAPARVVAVKVLRSGLFATDEECRRFLNEAEAVAHLDHPGIVPVYEVRRSRGLDFFSMKRVGGSSLDRIVRQAPLVPRDAAALVSAAARAVDHAHRRGILHRDLKPANILVDEAGQPFLTDFGLARRLDHDQGDAATGTGALLGTPGFMAPEQAEGKTHALTTATDVYGLGGVLYAALTGNAPHSGSSLAETLDRVRSMPPEPPSRINRRVPRDLEVICLKCLEKDPQRRYASARELAEDLDRWRAGEPILARPVSRLTRLRMWTRRHPLPAALAAALIAAVVAGLAGIGWQWREANRQRLQAERLLDYLANRLLAQASTEANPHAANLTVRELLDRQAARIGGEFQGQPELQAPLHEIIGNAYHSLGLTAPAEEHLRKALQLARALWGDSNAATLRIATRLGRVLKDTGRLEEARALLTKTRQTALRAAGPDDPTTLEAAARLGTVLAALHRPAEAEPLFRQVLAARRRVLPTDHPDTLRSVHDLCRLALETRQFREAESLAHEYEYGIRCARGPNHPDNIAALTNRGLIHRLQGNPAAAVSYYRQAVDLARRVLGPDHPDTHATEREYTALVDSLSAAPSSRSGRSNDAPTP